ncbi:ABC transporter [Escherichia coli]|nr:ABC transporter [Escherichia coli]
MKIISAEIPVPKEDEVLIKEGANKQVISSQADSLIKISRIWADFFPANTSNQPI